MKNLLLTLNLQYFAEGEGATEQVEGATNTEVTETKAEKTFTQSDVNNLIAKETKAAQEKLLKQAGLTDFENAKEGIAKFKEWQESQKTEAQKQAEALEATATKAQQLEAEKNSLVEKIAAYENEVKTESVDDVLALARLQVNEETDINTAIAKVLEKYPLFKKGAATEQEQAKPPVFTTGTHNPPNNDTPDPFAAKLQKLLGK